MSTTSFTGTWGAWELPSGSTNGMRVGIEVEWTDNSTGGAITHNTATAKATVYFWTQNRFAYDDTQTLNYSGNISGTKTYTNNTGPTSGTTYDTARYRDTKTLTYNYPAGSYQTSPTTRTFTAELSGVFGGITPSHSVSPDVPARPADNPTEPTVSSTPNNGSISVTYGAPADDGGVSISYYQYSPDNSSWTTTPSNPFTYPADNSAPNGTPITIYVRAVNTAGLIGSTASTTSTPRTTPGAPTSFAGSNTTFGQLGLSWAAPSTDGGNGVTSYVLRNGSTVLQNSSATSYTHTGLSPYTDYSYTVTAANAAGEGTAATLTVKTMGGVGKVWNGTTWVTTLPKVWNGTAWVEAQARMWNGTTWIHGI